jgi:hypothetical protein
LALPTLTFTEGSDAKSTIIHDARPRAYAAAARLPLDLYRDVADVTALNSGELVTRSLADDLADIHGDLAAGLRSYDAGQLDAAVWEWRFGFAHHWGAHAVNATRVLHTWLQDNRPDLLVENTPEDS